MLDYILNGQGQGSLANLLIENQMDPHCLRPWYEKGRHWISRLTQNQDGTLKRKAVLAQNANATLTKDAWIRLDTAVLKAFKPRLRVVSDMRSAGLTYSMPNAMGTPVLQYQRMTDITPATISMDALRQGENDRPEFDLVNLPLPIIHKDFSFSARQVAVSRNTGAPLDTTMAEEAAEQVAIEMEKLFLGISAHNGFAFGGGTIYGLTNFPSRLTKVMTAPTTSNQSTTVAELLDMRQLSINKNNFGPWVLYNSPAWDQWLDADYSANKGDNTLRDRIMKIKGITRMETSDYLTGYQMVLVQQSAKTARAVIGMDTTTVQWESKGGLEVHFKVMAICVPQLRSDIYGNTGIVHGTAPG